MEIVAIPIGDKVILYRPLRQMAFVGNRVMAREVLGLASPGRGAANVDNLSPGVRDYLQMIGFLEDDPIPPQGRDRTYRPTNAVILATDRCNLRCVYCYAAGGTVDTLDVSPALARKAIDHVYANAVKVGRHRFEVTFHGGGEPTLAWDMLQESVLYARSKDLPCHISMVTNGVWNQERARWILDHINRLTISVDGGPETQNQQRPFPSGKGSSMAVMDTLELLDRYGYDYGLRMTGLRPWRDRLAHDVRYLCEETGCRSIQVEPAFNTNRGEYAVPTSTDCADFVEGFMAAYEVAQRAGRKLRYSGSRPRTLTTTFCSAPYGGLIVGPTGALVTCYEITTPDHPLSELCTVGTLTPDRVSVDDAKRERFLDRLDARRAACRDCFCYWHCAGDCHVKTLYPTIDSTPISSPRCQVNRAIFVQELLWHIADSDDGVYRGRAGSGPKPATDHVAERNEHEDPAL